MVERRRAARLPTSFSVLYSSGREDRAGTVVALSRVGALVETVEVPVPALGTSVQLLIGASWQRPVEIHGRVVRHAEKGFAVEFVGVTVELLELLDLLGARS